MSGTNDNRIAFQKMIKDSSNHQFSIVLVYKLDRFSRNKYESVIHKKTLKDNGVKIISCMENIPDTPERTLMEALLEGFNKYFSEELTQKVNRGLKESWFKGNATGGQQFLRKQVFEDMSDIKIRKLVINTLVRQIHLYEDKIVILFNFTTPPDKPKLTLEENIQTDEQITSALNNPQSSCLLPQSAPKKAFPLKRLFYFI